MKDVPDIASPDLSEALDRAARSAHGSSLEIDFDHYQAYLDDPSLSMDQREEILEALWTIITAFVELGFGVHPAQQACGKPASVLESEANSESSEVRSNHTKQTIEQAPAPRQ